MGLHRPLDDRLQPLDGRFRQALVDRLVHLLPLRVPPARQGLKSWKERDHHREQDCERSEHG